MVDHRNDWTYALALPRGHPLYDERAVQSYRRVHECLAATLSACGQPAAVKTECDPCQAEPDLRAGAKNLSGGQVPPVGICFQRAELYDVINPRTGAKIAGAAQKRNKHGLLFQGSIEKGSVGPVDWEDFHARFAAALAQAIGTD
ncbi:MAG: lipoate--protein ligase family protein, partial [Opitutae bacterium]|nr:lipoate--protein ligase family protein [Opitutae bacterium]